MEQKAFYDDPGFDYLGYWRKREYEHRVEVDLLGRILPKKAESLLDVGAGYGRLLPVYRNRFERIVFLDPSEKLLSLARVKYGKKGLTYRMGVASKLPFRRESFQVVICIRVFHHLNSGEAKKTLEEMARVLVSGGTAFLEYANKIHLRARLRAIFSGKKSWVEEFDTIDRRGFRNVIGGSIPFNNFHPERIKEWAEEAGFKVKDHYSLSYLRPSFFKNFLPISFLVKVDSFLQEKISGQNWGPSNLVVLEKI